MLEERLVENGAVADDVGRHVYAIVRDHRDLEDMVGLDDSPLRLVRQGSIAAVVNDISLDRSGGRRADLMAYMRVLDELATRGPVIPVQFGSVLLDDESVLTEVLQGNEGYFSELLEQLQGRSQFQLRATYQDGVALTEIVSSTPTIAQLSRRTREMEEEESYAERVRLGELVARAMDEKRAMDIDALMEVVAGLATDIEVEPGTGTNDLATFSLLVDDVHQDELELRLEQLAESVHERIRLSLSGPMAPYDFTGGAAWD